MALELDISTISDVGRRRSRNEDAIGADADLGLLVVADGMGGHPAGDVASRMAVAEALRVLRETTPPGSSPSGTNDATHAQGSQRDAGTRMAEAVASADQRIREEGARDTSRAGMGTTLTALFLDLESSTYHIGHVGDSRAYRLRAGHFTQLTRDDTWVQTQVEVGRISPEKAREHPWASLLTQAVGLDQPAEPSVTAGAALVGDIFLVCSDGLITHLSDERVLEILDRELGNGLAAATQALVDAANEEGGFDNITVGLLSLRVGDAGTGNDLRSE